jgi:hypothetical protein
MRKPTKKKKSKAVSARSAKWWSREDIEVEIEAFRARIIEAVWPIVCDEWRGSRVLEAIRKVQP